MRILVANTPKMYREAIAVSLRLNRPDAEVLLGPPEALGGRVERFGPHLVVLDRGDGLLLLDGLPVALPRLEIRIGATMDGRISANGGGQGDRGHRHGTLARARGRGGEDDPRRGGAVAWSTPPSPPRPASRPWPGVRVSRGSTRRALAPECERSSVHLTIRSYAFGATGTMHLSAHYYSHRDIFGAQACGTIGE